MKIFIIFLNLFFLTIVRAYYFFNKNIGTLVVKSFVKIFIIWLVAENRVSTRFACVMLRSDRTGFIRLHRPPKVHHPPSTLFSQVVIQFMGLISLNAFSNFLYDMIFILICLQWSFVKTFIILSVSDYSLHHWRESACIAYFNSY